MRKLTQPKTITLTVSGTASPRALSRFLRWMADDVETIEKTKGWNRSVDYAFDPDSDYVEATTKRKVSER